MDAKWFRKYSDIVNEAEKSSKGVKVLYLEYYPNAMSMRTPINTEVELDYDTLSSLAALAKHDVDEFYDAFEALAKRDANYSEPHALIDLLRDSPKSLKVVANKGYWVGNWEEGSHALALPNQRSTVRKAMQKWEDKYSNSDYEEGW